MNNNIFNDIIDAADNHNDQKLESLIKQCRKIIDKPNQQGYTLLAWAASVGRAEKLAEMLIKGGANVNATNHHGNTPLMLAAFMGHDGIVKLLINNPQTDVYKRNHNQQNAAEIARSVNNTRIAEMVESEMVRRSIFLFMLLI